MQEEKRARLLAMRNQPDEDGFIKVISKSKSIFEDIEGKPKKKAKELKDFYRFQMRDTKKQQLIDLRIKFEKDKQRVEKAKQVRKFKPY